MSNARNTIAAAVLVGSLGTAQADTLPNADASTPTPVHSVCVDKDQTVAQAQACWKANGASSKQFGSEGGSEGGADSGESK